MSLWAAARCTSAAVPYFKPLEWQGQILLDGGFKLNCPASCAYSEAQSIWPDKHCDILLSLGTGRSTSNRLLSPAHNTIFRVAHAAAKDMTDAEAGWDEFMAKPLSKDGIFRLNPTYTGSGFELDEFQKLDEIERQAEEWITTQSATLHNICDQLIASLFFFHPLSWLQDGVHTGEILCRLPVGLGARQNLIDRMRQEIDPNLFVVEYNHSGGLTRVHIDVADALKSFDETAELYFPLKLHDFPAGVKIHVMMRSLCTPQSANIPRFEWWPISGSPYVV
jgi:hypothetical protein